MSTDGSAQPANELGWFGKLVIFRGSIGRVKYLLGLLAEFAILFLGLASLAGLNNPTGGGSFFGAAFFPLIALYVHMCLVIARFRDAGSPHPVPAGIIVAILPFAWVVGFLEYIESLWALILFGFVVLYFGPAFPKSKAAEAPQA
jgi:uncharacterized membrane protein YhaH (DUF805 family)